MIPVHLQPEPASFDALVRQKGRAYLQKQGIVLTGPVQSELKILPYWRDCLDDLHRSYGGVCAYLAVYIERVTGGSTADHFIAKSTDAGQAYEWSNYRLACSTMNSRKRNYSDVLDPFDVQANWFRLELTSGRIFTNPTLDTRLRNAVQQTIDRLSLDDGGNREMRARHYEEYCSGLYTATYLQRRSPFVYLEAARQQLL